MLIIDNGYFFVIIFLIFGSICFICGFNNIVFVLLIFLFKIFIEKVFIVILIFCFFVVFCIFVIKIDVDIFVL